MDEDFKSKYRVSNSQENIVDFGRAKAGRTLAEAIENPSGIPIKRYESIEDYERKEELKRRQEKRRRQMRERNENFRAPKGSARRAKAARRSNKIKTRVVATVLSAIALGTAVGIFHSHVKGNSQEISSVEQLLEQGENPANLGLSQETIDTLLEYSEYFSDRENMFEKDISSVAQELYDLNLFIIKEKVAKVTGHDPKDLEIRLGFDKADGIQSTSISLKDDSYSSRPNILYSGLSSKIIPISDETTLPEDVCDLAWQLDTISTLQDEIASGKISDANAWKKLQKCYGKISEFSTQELIKGENGRLALVSYESNKEEVDKAKDEGERE